jgi:hypothetical protein
MSFLQFVVWLLRRWYFWAFVCVCLLTVGAVTWYYSEGDLRAVDAKAHAMGVPTTWAELGLKVSSQERRDKLQEIYRLQGNLKSFYETNTDSSLSHKTFAPPSPEIIAFQNALNPSEVQNLLKEITELGSDPLILRDSWTYSTLTPEIGQNRNVMRFLEERALVVPAPEAASICRIALQFARSSQSSSLIGHLVQNSLFEITETMITEHFNAVAQFCPEISHDLEEAADSLDSRFQEALIEEFLCNRHFLISPQLTDRGATGLALGARLGRRILLDQHLNVIDIERANKSESEKWQDFRKLEAKIRTQYVHAWWPHHQLIRLLFSNPSIVKKSQMKTSLHARLLAAELQGKSWPPDVFHPTNAPLHRVERDGILVGAYSVGENGVDDGGDCTSKKDLYLPIRGPQKPLSATKAKLVP